MSHIADFLVPASSSVGLNNYIARELSPHSLQDVVRSSYPVFSQLLISSQSQHATPQGTPTEEKEKFVWRMHQPAEPRKYQLFPAKEKLCIATPPGRKSPDQEAALQLVPGGEKTTAQPAVRTKAKEPTLIRRRKVSVPELGTMTTVQEVAMDSRKSKTD
jgi:hypothetical protein